MPATSLSSETLQIIKNFATIFTSLVIPAGNILSTTVPDRTVVAIAQVAETFPVDAMIYDASNFLAVISLIERPLFDWQETEVIITSEVTSQVVHWRYGNRNLLAKIPPTSFVPMESHGDMKLPKETMQGIIRAASLLGHDSIVLSNSDAGVTLSTVHSEAPPSREVSSRYQQTLVPERVGDEDWSFAYNTARVNVIAQNYTARVSRKGGLELAPEGENSFPVTYRIAPNATRQR